MGSIQTLGIFTFVIAASFSGMARADNSARPDLRFDAMGRSWFQVGPVKIPDGDGGLLAVLDKHFSNVPDAKVGRPSASPQCSAGAFADLMRSSPDDLSVVQKALDGCEKELSSQSKGKVQDLLRFGNEQYALWQSPSMREVVISLPSGFSARGVLALKDSVTPRPLVIAVCGTACDSADGSMQAYMMNLFDESPFNVLFLANLTGTEEVDANRTFGFGGVEEGREVMNVISMLSTADSPLLPIISSIHVLGVSLGGQAALYTSLYASANPVTGDVPRIGSVLGVCPVVNLHDTLAKMDDFGIVGMGFRDTLKSQVAKSVREHDVDESIFTPAEIAELSKPPLPGHALSYIAEAAVGEFRALVALPEFLMAPFLGLHVNTVDDYWDAHNFLLRLDQVQIPTLVMGAKNDMIVNSPLNYEKVQAAVATGKYPKIHTLLTEQGGHCGFSTVYGEGFTSAILRGFVLGHSPEYSPGLKNQSQTLATLPGYPAFSGLSSEQKFVGTFWHVNAGDTSASLHARVWHSCREGIAGWFKESTPFNAPDGCYDDRQIPVPLAQFGAIVSVPTNETEAQALTRWLNTSVSVETTGQSAPIDSVLPPATMKWASQ